MRRLLWFGVALLATLKLEAQPKIFPDVQIRFNRSDKNRRLIEKKANLVFEDTARRLQVDCPQKSFAAGYDEVDRVVFDATTHVRNGKKAAGLGLGARLAAGVGGTMVDQLLIKKDIQDYWLYVKRKDGEYVVVEIPKELSAEVIEKARAVFGSRVSEFQTTQGERSKAIVLPSYKLKHSVKVDKLQHPEPALLPDKSLIVVVCPLIDGNSRQNKLHANDKVIAVNYQGTYSFAYLEPGEYTFVNQLGGAYASGFKLTVEAGKSYYFLQNPLNHGFASLSQQSEEIVRHEMSGANFADWKLK